MSAGYSGTPLAKKLGIKPGMQIVACGAPEHYAELLAPLPADVEIVRETPKRAGFIHFFTARRTELEAELPRLKSILQPDGVLWLSWPKKSSGVASDLDGNIVRALGLGHGLVDIKVCAVDAIWSGLKFVYRLKDR